jgi:D-alanyl-D-alanine carboxypeptidase
VATFYRALLRGRLLSPQLLRAMETTVAEGAKTDFPGQRYGLGLERFRTPCGVAWGHGGNFPGYLVYAFTSAGAA